MKLFYVGTAIYFFSVFGYVLLSLVDSDWREFFILTMLIGLAFTWYSSFIDYKQMETRK